MHWYRSKADGKERLWMEEEEFESFTEGELRSAALYPTTDRPAVDIERFIQRHMKALIDQHADLGSGIGGAIEFEAAWVKIFISRQLTEMVDEAGCPLGVRGRWRATMAHEAAHGLLHRRVFEASPAQGSLFEAMADETPCQHQTITCSEADICFELGTYDWREYQANRAMAALLMPRRTFVELARQETARLCCRNQPICPGSREHCILVRRLAAYFEVSQRAASIRLKVLEGAVGVGQGRLVAANR